ncbi:uncharacterized protein PHACADRAFT_246138 [Phanerochaete carnosa HHB-10118-sp]|uniref:Uncharacterized protein n=1 Tax=Phanerochaete carnosa (strain HHB-10118-sp) TaxID=650164 RepID=K5XBC8_PHACS|nr:uncharacterized protein PHACADRAFT_246138 [Phanerochaete carnosa HHB-10118-sp]EKM60267.1 hypothetical protein PHACADRAFT_246138 [Phanerochaete carnosa HHB-10118-sp]
MEGLCFHTLSLSATVSSGITFCLWDDHLSVDGPLSKLYSGEDAHFSCSLRTPRGSFMIPLIQELPPAQIECAFLSEQPVGLDYVPWEAVLTLMPSVKNLVVQYKTFDYLMTNT